MSVPAAPETVKGEWGVGSRGKARTRLPTPQIPRARCRRPDPWTEASLLDCAGDFVRVADDLGLERFAALGVSGGAPYVIALVALAPERVGRVAVVCGADVGMDEGETPEELTADLGEEARMLREDPEEWYAGLVAEVAEVDRRVLERPEVRAVAIHHGEDDMNVPPQYAKELAERIPGSQLRLYPGEGHISILDNPIKEIVETLLDP